MNFKISKYKLVENGILYFFIFSYLLTVIIIFSLLLNLSKKIENSQQVKINKGKSSLVNVTESEVIKQYVEVTAYNAEVGQTDSTPTITASGKTVKIGYVALSRDLEKKYNLKFGDIIYIPILNRYKNYPVFYEFQDRMNKRIKNSVDIFLWDKKKALRFGRRNFEIYIIKIRD